LYWSSEWSIDQPASWTVFAILVCAGRFPPAPGLAIDPTAVIPQDVYRRGFRALKNR
jgi:hypothetical protein